jgi:NTE family protein
MDWPSMFEDRTARAARSFRRKRDDDLALVAGKPGIGNSGIKLGSGLLAGERVHLMLERLTQPVATRPDFDHLPIPFRAVATDLNTGEAVVLGDGSLALAMRASMSIPGVFRPVRHGERLLVDGGLANQVPIDVVRAMGADVVIAVDVGSPLVRLDESASPLDIVDQISGFMTVGSAARQIATLGPQDVLIRPQFDGEFGADSFERLDDALKAGDAAAVEARPRLAALHLDAPRYDTLAAARPAADTAPPVIRFVRLENRSRYADSVLINKVDVPIGEPLDVERLEAGLQRIYGMDTFDLVTYDVVEEDGASGLVVTVVPHAVGPNYLEAGLSVYSDFNSDFFFNLRAGVLRAPFNDRGGEVRGLLQVGDEPGALIDVYQPIGASGDWFVGGLLSVETPRFSEYDADGERIASYRAPNWGGELVVGREFGNYGAATLTLRRREGRAEVELGDPVIGDVDYDLGEVEINATFDRIDSTYMPREGTYAVGNVLLSDTHLGADADFVQGGIDATHARSWGKHSAIAGVRYHASSDEAIPPASQYRLGGLTRFAGYRPNERLAENYALAYGGYSVEIGRFLNRPVVLGGTLEYGKSWQHGIGLFDDGFTEIHGSVYLGIDSWLGPLQLGYGIREDGDGVMLLEIGRQR